MMISFEQSRLFLAAHSSSITANSYASHAFSIENENPERL